MDETSHLKGLKFLIPDGSEIQQSELTARLNGEKKRLLSEHFVCSRSMIKGIWIPHMKRVELENIKGKFWNQMGYSEGQKNYLYPEEALFLLEEGKLEIINEAKVVLNVCDAYSTLLSNEINIASYQVYAYLLRAGYIVRRHMSLVVNILNTTIMQEKLTTDKRKRSLEHLRRTDWKSKRFCRDNQDHYQVLYKNNFSKEVKNKLSTSSCYERSIASFTETAVDEDCNSASNSVVEQCREQRHIVNSPNVVTSETTSMVPFPNCAGVDSITLLRPPAALLPSNSCPLWYSRTFTNCRLLINRKAEITARDQQQETRTVRQSEVRYDFDAACGVLAPVRACDGERYFGGDVQSLVSNANISSNEIYSRLRIVPESPLPLAVSDHASSSSSCQLMYDIFKATKNFSKTRAGSPDYSVYIARPNDLPPTLDDICALERQANGIPVLTALVDCGTIAFYMLNTMSVVDLTQT